MFPFIMIKYCVYYITLCFCVIYTKGRKESKKTYKKAIVSALEDDIVLSERITGVPVSVIKTPYIERTGTKAGLIEKWFLKGNTTKHWMRTFYALRSLRQFKKSNLDQSGKFDYWQAGKSVSGIHEILPVADIMDAFKQKI